MDLTDLISKLEAAEGPSRELDADIHEAVGLCAHREQEYYCVEDGNDVDSGYTCKRCGKDMYGRSGDVKLYTASLDAALTLVPEGWGWTIERDDLCASVSLWFDANGEDREAGATHAHPAISLCIASLRARQALAAPAREEG